MKKALIGYTGFVGSNLQAQIKFDDFYNSKNIQDIKDKEYDVVVRDLKISNHERVILFDSV